MRAYISGALLNAADLDRSRAVYEAFAAACREAGWETYLPHEHADPIRDAHLTNRDVAERDLDEITASDAVVAYIGEPSLGVGAEVALALTTGKRVLAVADEGRRVSRFLVGLLELHPDSASFYRYRSLDDACAWIRRTLISLVQ